MSTIDTIGIVLSYMTGYLIVAGTTYALVASHWHHRYDRIIFAWGWPLTAIIYLVVLLARVPRLIGERLIAWRQGRRVPKAQVRK